MGRLLGETFDSVRADMLIPIPLHISGRREYNQSLLLAEGVSSVWGIPAEDGALIWRKNVGSQAGKTVSSVLVWSRSVPSQENEASWKGIDADRA